MKSEMALPPGSLKYDEHAPVLALPDAGLVADLVGPRAFMTERMASSTPWFDRLETPVVVRIAAAFVSRLQRIWIMGPTEFVPGGYR